MSAEFYVLTHQVRWQYFCDQNENCSFDEKKINEEKNKETFEKLQAAECKILDVGKSFIAPSTRLKSMYVHAV